MTGKNLKPSYCSGGGKKQLQGGMIANAGKCLKFELVKIKPRKISGIRPGFPGTARQGRCAVNLAIFFVNDKPQNT
jgi:hypothetical protein